MSAARSRSPRRHRLRGSPAFPSSLAHALLVPLLALMHLCFDSDTAGAVIHRTALLNGNSWREFDQVNATGGALAHDRHRSYEGAKSVRATLRGGANGYARGIFNVAWPAGEDVWFGAAYYIPKSFDDARQGQVDLMRWDNFGALGTNDDRSGVVVHRNGRANLMRMKFGVENVDIGPSFRLPEGRWFWLEVHQHLSPEDGAASSEVFLDDVLVSSATSANMYGTAVDRVRFGLVAIDAARQQRPLELWFDRTTVSRERTGALAG